MESTIRTAATGLGLGRVTAMSPVDGGLSNDMWRVGTDEGEFAIKVMRVHADSAGFQDSIESAFVVEKRAFRAGVPCPEPMPTSEGRALLRAEGTWVRAHRWCEGTAAAPGECLEEAGHLLARIHRVGRRSTGAISDRPHGGHAWRALGDQGGLPALLADQLRAAATRLARLESMTAVSAHRRVELADSHGDLDPKNTLRSAEQLLAVDWDAAGRRSLERESVGLALDWATGITSFHRVLSAYTGSTGLRLPAEPWVFGGWVAALSDWLVFNVEHRAESDLGRREASQTCDRLLALHRDLDAHLAVLSAL
ncbi:phosphotransferase [Brachybacterium sp. NBEC-018]|uniref:phosphotransferase enzyme family protein n=1 Tax=Brachybacterium sp. NBEC-018 TaxID=2996004 RepID=UPI00217526EB|nr:phosphotransferase [Brachybacterium sp. NBEC-018]UVY82396.1 phosphotransferase [Brachybacterium sp. NBEC-018]